MLRLPDNRHKIIRFWIVTFLLIGYGCSTRQATPVIDENETTIYPPKDSTDLKANLILCKKMSKKSGKLIGIGSDFFIKEKAKVRATIDISNRENYADKDLLFHLDWIGSNGRSFYRKEFTVAPDDSINTLISSVSINPEKRQPGEYKIRLYFYRELIAEKTFTLRPGEAELKYIADHFETDITLYRKIDKKKNILVDVGTEFRIKKKRKVRAAVYLRNNGYTADEELDVKLIWKDANNEEIYKKQTKLQTNEAITSFKSSISINPKKRKPGTYSFEVMMSDSLIAKQTFTLTK